VIVKSAAMQSNATATARPERLFWRQAETLQRYRGPERLSRLCSGWTGSLPPPKQSYAPIARLSPAPVQW
jgi:hypothetical protein